MRPHVCAHLRPGIGGSVARPLYLRGSVRSARMLPSVLRLEFSPSALARTASRPHAQVVCATWLGYLRYVGLCRGGGRIPASCGEPPGARMCSRRAAPWPPPTWPSRDAGCCRQPFRSENRATPVGDLLFQRVLKELEVAHTFQRRQRLGSPVNRACVAGPPMPRLAENPQRFVMRPALFGGEKA